jgi:hypothetical protein
MRSYAVEIKGIAMPGMLKDNLPGELCVGKLQPGQLGSILGNLLNETLFNRNLLFELATSARPQTRYCQLRGLRRAHYEGA